MQRLVVLAVVLCACRQDEARPDSVAAAPPPPAAVGVDSTTPACPATGLWAQCALVERLDRSGLVPRVDSAARVDEPPLTVPGTLVRVGNSELEVYLYPTIAAREADAAKLDATKYLAYGAPVPIQPTPTLIQSANLIAIFHSRNDHQRERVGDAITAGPPQPARP